jgi:hypothetical protein
MTKEQATTIATSLAVDTRRSPPSRVAASAPVRFRNQIRKVDYGSNSMAVVISEIQILGLL